MTKRSALGYDLTPLSAAEKQKRAEKLDAQTKRVVLHAGTEAPFCGQFYDHAEDGVYECVLCDLRLYHSDHKFHSKSGWPSFFQAIDKDHIKRVEDFSHGMHRVEICCVRCDAHLGHVFPDGPLPTGERHCLNSVSLNFVPKSF